MSTTILKDPVYGYVEFEEDVVNIIDTPNFQRLRDIVQTSYAPLFHNSIHNRFSHSLGVYHLGRKAINSLLKNFRKTYGTDTLSEIDEETIKNIFLKACLLHDIGHSPFSHTGEEFYFDEKVDDTEFAAPKLIDDLGKYLNNKEYSEDVQKQQFCEPKPHEYMSAYFGLQEFLPDLDSDDASFFVRCIIGLQYYDCKSPDKQLRNACIELLNSTTIDVDKLDYLIRDTYMTGFSSISIDYERLLAGVSINILAPDATNNIITENTGAGAKITRRHIFVAFKKAAISVLENVILANDLERKWIQSHPVVLYGSFLLQVIIHNINQNIAEKSKKSKKESNEKTFLFSYNSLTEKGTVLRDKSTVRFLSDSDILYLAKNSFYDEWAKEYFARSEWRHPLWKSQAEFQMLTKNNNLNELLKVISNIEKDLLSGEYGQNCINEDLLKAYKKQQKNGSSVDKSKIANESVKAVNAKLSPKINFLMFLKDYCKTHNIAFDFVVITNKQFTSGMNKEDFKNIQIQFDSLNASCCLYEALPVLSSDIFKDNYFYLFNKIDDSHNQVDTVDFCKQLASYAVAI